VDARPGGRSEWIVAAVRLLLQTVSPRGSPQWVTTEVSTIPREIDRLQARQQFRRTNMHHTKNRFTGTAMSAVAASVFAILAGSASLTSAQADETQAKTLFKAMTDYLAAQKAISFDYDSNLEVVSTDKQKLGLASSGTLTLNRPDKVHMTRTGGFANAELTFDGKTVTLFGKKQNAYVQVDEPGTVDKLVDALRKKFQKPMPAADLLMSDPHALLMSNVTDVKDLGSGVIRGQECNHIAARSDNADWQLWIAQGDRPYPCRLVITSTNLPESPEYTIDIRSWKAGAEVASDPFKIDVANAKKIDAADLPDFNEVPAVFAAKKTIGQAK
jgi:hypothetical protein